MRIGIAVPPIVCMVALLFFSQCKSIEKQGKENVMNDTVLLASIERTPCFGICPVYKIYIYQSGLAVLHGIQHVPNIGWFNTRLGIEQVNAIIRYAEDNKIFNLQDEYIEPRIADYPTTITELNLNNRYKRIVNTQPSAPQVLLNWEKFLDSFFNDRTHWQLMKAPQDQE